jgi:heme a synthase
MNQPNSLSFCRWPNRVARWLAVVSFVLIFAGGLVTTTAAGMAVPDWPNTYGYNMFLYPFYDWFFGPWDLFVEHGHRLLGTLAGIFAILLVIVTFRKFPGTRLPAFAIVLLALVIFQGTLGGVRVLRDDRTIANLHGVVGPAFFALVVAFCVISSRWYRRNVVEGSGAGAEQVGTENLAWAQTLLGLSFLQLVLGSLLRHIDVMTSPRGFPHLVYTHIAVAVLLMLATWWYWWRTRRMSGTGLRWPVNLLSIVIFVQVALGLITWVMKYGFPWWLDHYLVAASFVIPDKTMQQTLLVTAHMAMGSAILCFWTVHVVRMRGLLKGPALQ